MPKNTRTFVDLDLNFAAHPVTKDLPIVTDTIAIKRSVKNLVLTTNFEYPFHSEIGSPVKSLLFDNYTPLLPILIQKAIQQTITNFEPRVVLLDVSVYASPDTNSIYVKIYFKIVNTETPQTVDITLQRTR